MARTRTGFTLCVYFDEFLGGLDGLVEGLGRADGRPEARLALAAVRFIGVAVQLAPGKGNIIRQHKHSNTILM